MITTVDDPQHSLKLVNFQQLNLDDNLFLCVSRDRSDGPTRLVEAK